MKTNALGEQLTPTLRPQSGIKDALFLLVLFWMTEATGQIVGTTKCACQPSSWTFTLSLSAQQLCQNHSSLFEAYAVSQLECSPPTFNLGWIDDTQFTSIHLIQILELDQLLVATSHQLLEPENGQSFADGHVFGYQSLIATSKFNETSLPSSLVLLFSGTNRLGQALDASWSVTFSNDCHVFPVLSENTANRATYLTEINHIEDPPQSICPLASGPILPVPSSAPTRQPSFSPSAPPTFQPSAPPSISPSGVPSASPSAVRATSQPTLVPSFQPSWLPTILPSTPAPTDNKKEIGTNVCACQPSQWDFELDFRSFCPTSNKGAFGPRGVRLEECFDPWPLDSLSTSYDTAFAMVDWIHIIELDQKLHSLQHYFVPGGPFSDGHVFQYQSVLKTNTTFDAVTLPSTLVMIFEGANSHSERLTASWSVQFSNACDELPSVTGRENTLLTLVTDVVDPPQRFCPLAPEPPSVAPFPRASTVIPTISAAPTVTPEIGKTICACHPSDWHFTLDFSADCPASGNGTFDSGGVLREECFPPWPLAPVEFDLKFHELSNIHILELDQNLDVLTQTVIDGAPFVDGDSFTYTGILTNNAEFNLTSLPSTIVAIFEGTNVQGRSLVASWSVQFTNSCNEFPVVLGTEETLLTRVNFVKDPPNKFCPLAPAPAPTLQPTKIPTPAPTVDTTLTPTTSLIPTDELGPSSEPTDISVCACHPASWTFAFNFSSPCSASMGLNGTFGPDGVLREECLVGSSEEGVTDFVFDSVSRILIVELDRDRNSIKQELKFGPFRDGDIFEYDSVLAKKKQQRFTALTIPQTIIVVMVGVNVAAQSVEASWSVDFSNDCDVFPVVFGGERTIATLVQDVTDPPQSYCPLAPVAPSEAPSVLPSLVPSPIPTTLAPSDSPSELKVTEVPSIFPTDTPSMRPTRRPQTEPPVASSQPSTNPSSTRSSMPSLSPSVLPTHAPSHAPSNGPTSGPSVTPSAITDTPSATPVPSIARPKPTRRPTLKPITTQPTQRPSPTKEPSRQPVAQTNAPTFHPIMPSQRPTPRPTPSVTVDPTAEPTVHVTTTRPSLKPSRSPSCAPVPKKDKAPKRPKKEKRPVGKGSWWWWRQRRGLEGGVDTRPLLTDAPFPNFAPSESEVEQRRRISWGKREDNKRQKVVKRKKEKPKPTPSPTQEPTVLCLDDNIGKGGGKGRGGGKGSRDESDSGD